MKSSNDGTEKGIEVPVVVLLETSFGRARVLRDKTNKAGLQCPANRPPIRFE